jgi:Flp pilus assembly protein TadD
LADAETEARATLKLAPDRAESHYGLASVLVRRGDPEAAIPEFKRAIAIQPDGIRNRTGLAVAYAASIGEFDEADREFQAALKIDSQNPVLLADMDYVHRLRARLTHQLELAETALKEHPERGVTRSQVALLLVRAGYAERGLSEIREALKQGPDTWQMHYTLAIALFATHDYKGAEAAMADAKKLGSGNRPFIEEAIRSATAAQPAQ